MIALICFVKRVFSLFCLPIVLMLTLSSCAKMGYLLEQGYGQMKLNYNAKSNKDILKDSKISIEVKEKIKRVEEYKRFFYKYWNKTPSDIYTKTSFLEQKAVSYMVIASKFDEVKAHTTNFPFMGSFPYLAFFKKSSAQKYAFKMELDNYVTYTRDVYAYSTLGYLTDPIVSSFFYYSEVKLAEVIFHELFHTIFFIKDDVDFNENIANYVGQEMRFIFFRENSSKVRAYRQEQHKILKVKMKIVTMINKLNKRYEDARPISKMEAQIILNKFLNEEFLSGIKLECDKVKIKHCYYDKIEWNNASMSQFLTYEKDIDKIIKLRSKLNCSLQDFFKHIEHDQQIYKKLAISGKFSKYLFRDI